MAGPSVSYGGALAFVGLAMPLASIGRRTGGAYGLLVGEFRSWGEKETRDRGRTRIGTARLTAD